MSTEFLTFFMVKSFLELFSEWHEFVTSLFSFSTLKDGSLGIIPLCQKTGVRKWARQTKHNYDNTLVPTETLPIPASEPFRAGNTLVRSRRIHTLLIWTSTWSQTFINIWKNQKARSQTFYQNTRTQTDSYDEGEKRHVLPTFWWGKQ